MSEQLMPKYHTLSDQQLRAKYFDLCHAVQSGVAAYMNYDKTDTTPKHLRTGINISMSDMGGLVSLLISKGVFTEREHLEHITEFTEREVKSYEDRLNKVTGGNIKLY